MSENWKKCLLTVILLEIRLDSTSKEQSLIGDDLRLEFRSQSANSLFCSSTSDTGRINGP